MDRRDFLKRACNGAAAAAVASSTLGSVAAQTIWPGAAPLPTCPTPMVHTPEGPVPVPLVRATPDRIISLTVCTRPFRMLGPRIESERLGRKIIVHNDSFYMLPRRDGILLQTQYPGDFNNTDITPDRAAAERTVQSLAELNERIRARLACEPVVLPAP
jgi:hypothetical protein